jgi:hypothetical protein
MTTRNVPFRSIVFGATLTCMGLRRAEPEHLPQGYLPDCES